MKLLFAIVLIFLSATSAFADKPPVGSTVNAAAQYAPPTVIPMIEGSGRPIDYGTAALATPTGYTPTWATITGHGPVAIFNGGASDFITYGTTGNPLAGKRRGTIVWAGNKAGLDSNQGPVLQQKNAWNDDCVVSMGPYQDGSYGFRWYLELCEDLGALSRTVNGHTFQSNISTDVNVTTQIISTFDLDQPAGSRIKFYRNSALLTKVMARDDGAFSLPTVTRNINVGRGAPLSEATLKSFNGRMSYLIIIPDLFATQTDANNLFANPFSYMITSPLLTSIGHSGIDHDSANIAWTTEVNANSCVDYGIGSYASTICDETLVTSHGVTLPNLNELATYQYRVRSTASGTTATSSKKTFTTLGRPAVISPLVWHTTSSSKFCVSFTTDINTTAVLDYGTTESYGSQKTSSSGKSHTLCPDSLNASTVYNLRPTVTNSSGNTTVGVNRTATTKAADVTAPSAIGDLAASRIASTRITLTWTAPGDDTTNGRPTSYVIKRSLAVINAGNFDAATTVTNSISPKAAGGFEEFYVSGLTASTPYYFAVKGCDEANNCGSISNVINPTTTAGRPDYDWAGGDKRLAAYGNKNVGVTRTATSTGLSCNVLTDAAASFNTDGRMIGTAVTPKISYVESGEGLTARKWYRVTGATETTLTTDSRDGCLTSIAVSGDTYMVTGISSYQWWGKRPRLVTPEGYTLFGRGLSSFMSSFAGGSYTVYPYQVIYLKNNAGTYSTNLKTAGHNTVTNDVVHSSHGFTVRDVGDEMYIGDERPGFLPWFQGTYGSGGVLTWEYSCNTGWCAMNTTGNPWNPTGFSSTAQLNFTAPTMTTSTTGGSIAGGQTIQISVAAIEGGFERFRWFNKTITIPSGTSTNSVTITLPTEATYTYAIYGGVGVGTCLSGTALCQVANNKVAGSTHVMTAIPTTVSQNNNVTFLDMIGFTRYGRTDGGMRRYLFNPASRYYPSNFQKTTITGVDATPRFYVRARVVTAYTTGPKLSQLYDAATPFENIFINYQDASVSPVTQIQTDVKEGGWNIMGIYAQEGFNLLQSSSGSHTHMMGIRGHLLTLYSGSSTKCVYQGIPGAGDNGHDSASRQPDVWEPALKTHINSLLTGSFNRSFRTNPVYIGVKVDEPDYMWGMGARGSRTWLPYAMLVKNAYTALNCNFGGQGVPADKRFYGKYTLRNWLRWKYKPAGDSTPEVTRTTITSSTDTYTSAGPDPNGTDEQKALYNLNQAWGTSYTTWGTSSGNLLTGTNAWGSGTGFMDEDGRHIITSGATATKMYVDNIRNFIKKEIYDDLRLFSALTSCKYAEIVYKQVREVTGNMIIPIFYGPPLEMVPCLAGEADVRWTDSSKYQVFGDLGNSHSAAENYDVQRQKDIYNLPDTNGNPIRQPFFFENYSLSQPDSPYKWGGPITAISFNSSTGYTSITWTGDEPQNRESQEARVRFPDSPVACQAVAAGGGFRIFYTGSTGVIQGNLVGCVEIGHTIRERAYLEVNDGTDIFADTQDGLAIWDKDIANNMFDNMIGADGHKPMISYQRWQHFDNPQHFAGENMAFGIYTPRINRYNGTDSVSAVSLGPQNQWVGGEKENYGDYWTTTKAVLLELEDRSYIEASTPVAPAFVSGNSQTFVPGNLAESFIVRTSGTLAPKLSITTGALPGGMVFIDNGDGSAYIGGVPALRGTYVFTITASNNYGSDATQQFTLTIEPPTPTTRKLPLKSGKLKFRGRMIFQ